MKSIVTGIFGMDAQNLASILLDKGHEVIGTHRYSSIPTDERQFRRSLKSRLKLVCADLTDTSGISRLIQEYQPNFIFNLAAMSHVQFSFTDPISTFNIDTIGPLNLLEAIRLHSPHTKMYQACHDEETKVVTPYGEKSYNEIQIGDLVSTINEKTHRVEFKPVKKIHINNYQGKMIKIKSIRLDQLVTPNHKVMIESIEDNEIIKIDAINLSALLNNKKLYRLPSPLPKKGLDNKEINFYDYIEKSYTHHRKNLIDKMDAKDFFYLLGIFIGDGWVTTFRKKRIVCRQIRGEHGKFIKMDNKEYKEHRGAGISLAVPETDPARQKILNILEKYNINYQCEKVKIIFSCYPLAKMFHMCDFGAHNKKIPNFAWDYSAEILQFLASGLNDSDGRSASGNKVIATVSKTLSSQILLLGSILGRTATQYFSLSKGNFLKNGRFIPPAGAYKATINANNTSDYIYNKYVSTVDYSGKVWCLEVEDNHNFLIVRNGKTAYSGNSTSEMFGKNFDKTDDGLVQSINTPFKPSSPYGIAKLASHHLIRIYREGYGIFAVSGILFNHTDIHRTPTFFERKVSIYGGQLKRWLPNRTIKEDEKLLIDSKSGEIFPKLALGEIEGVYRDIGWSYDYMAAALLMLEQDEPNDYVVATGEAKPLKDILRIAVGEDYNRFIYKDPKLVRPVDVPYLRGDSRPIRELGWSPTKSFEQLMNMLVKNDT